MNTDKLKGIAVVAMAEGAKLGTIDRALFDPATLELRALQITGDGRTFIVPWELVQTIGADAVMVASSQVAQTAAQGGPFGNLVDLSALQRLKVVDAAGTLVGTITDLEPDPTTGRPLRLIIHKGGFLGRFGETTMIDAAAIRGIGADIITVTDASLTVIGEPAPTPAIL
jgi:sporulation protein YlmC with PRC-barrel domain